MNRLAFFVSGSGTNMDNLVRCIQAGKIKAQAALVVCDKPEAAAITKAERLQVPVALVDRKKFSSKADFEGEIMRHLETSLIDYVILAGFMRILSPEFVRRYKGRVINIHPSLLPHFPGAHGIRDAFEAKVNQTGVTVHFVDEGVDTGPIILQRSLAVNSGETLESLEERIHKLEYEIYPEALNLVLSGKLKMGKS